MKKKWISLLLGVVMVCTLLTGCDGSSGRTGYIDSVNTGVSMDSVVSSDSYSESYRESYNKSDINSSGYDVEETRQDVKRIYTGYFDLEAVDFDTAVGTVESMVYEMNGYLEDEQVYTRNSYWDSDTYREASMTIRVPADQFAALVSDLEGDDTMSVVRRSVSTEDVSESYYDIATRLEVAQTEVEQLQELLKRAEAVQDVISVREALSDAVYEVESLQGRLNSYDSRIQYSTLDVTITEVTALTMTAKAVGYGSKLAESFVNGFTGGIEFFGDLLLAIAGNWLVLVVLVIVIILIVRVSRKHAAKRREKKAAAKAAKKKEQEDQRKEIEELRKCLSEDDGNTRDTGTKALQTDVPSESK